MNSTLRSNGCIFINFGTTFVKNIIFATAVFRTINASSYIDIVGAIFAGNIGIETWLYYSSGDSDKKLAEGNDKLVSSLQQNLLFVEFFRTGKQCLGINRN